MQQNECKNAEKKIMYLEIICKFLYDSKIKLFCVVKMPEKISFVYFIEFICPLLPDKKWHIF